jgi:hypothetical protein
MYNDKRNLNLIESSWDPLGEFYDLGSGQDGSCAQ